jgi:chromosome segregation ATPase
VAVAEHEGGFGSGLRAKLAKETDEPRSPAEAIAAAAEDDPDVELLRNELTASLAREQGLRSSLHEQVEVSGREVRLEHDIAGQAAALDARAAALAATEAELEERERQISARLAELDNALDEKDKLA